MKGEDKIMITKCSGILNWILDQENKCGKGNYWDNWPNRSKGNHTLSTVSPFNFLNLINALCSYKRVFLGDGMVKHLGGKDHTV